MPEREPLTVILCWHMHQPEYRDLATGNYRFPWTLLHALKDYVDMAAHLEAEPAARAVVNFAPVLLEQVEDYAQRLGAHLAHGRPLPDPLLAALAGELPAIEEGRLALIGQCLRANEKRVIDRFPAYAKLARLARRVLEDPEDLRYVADAFLFDLVTWYHLAWLGESVRRDDPRVAALEQRGQGFSAAERRTLLELVHGLLCEVLPRYRRLADAGRVELAMSPYAHPILPLMLDLGAGREALPDSALPRAAEYPGGLERARWHLREGRAVFRRLFGHEPAGCWPSEGALSTATLRLLEEEGFRWSASGEGVLRHSDAAGGLGGTSEEPAAAVHVHGAGRGDGHAPKPGDRHVPVADAGASHAAAAAGGHVLGNECRHRVYRVGGIALDCFFRDDGLSDLIGFSYADWHAQDAVANLLYHMDNIAAVCPDTRNCALTVILDGENAWEYYPDNAFHFFEALYRGIAGNRRLALDTFSSFLASKRPAPARLPRLVAGSWVYGTLSTWVGSADKNRGWEMLVEAKQACDRVLAAGGLDAAARAAVERQLAVCEGSDWFWWFGDYNPAQSVSDFEGLFRLHLVNLYRMLGQMPPSYLADSFTHGSGDPARGGVMRTGAAPT